MNKVVSVDFLKRGEKIGFLLIVILISFFPFISGETNTSLEVPNAPPYLVMNIPDQSWPENQSNLNAFDLDDYFLDQEGIPLSYYNSSINDIFVYIDPITHEVSFFPRQSFSGIRNVTFYASDSVYDTLSNVVTLYVGIDTEPPKWYTPSKDKTVIYQNDIVNFFTNWTDDRNLQYYIFSMNQGAGWVNYSSVSFSGMENISSQSIQIMAPALNLVYWRIYAFDTSGNTNSTSIQSFMIISQVIPPSDGGEDETPEENTGVLSGIFEKINVLQTRKVEDFQLSVSEFKVSLKQGTSKTRVLKVTNTGLEEIFLNVSSPKLKDFIIFSNPSFSVLPGKSKEITIDFNAPQRTIPGQYFGYIIVQSPNIKKSIPTVLDVQGIDLDFDLSLNLSEEYKLIKPGKDIKVNITLTNLKDLRDVEASLYYAIKDYSGKVYNFSEEDISFFSTLILERTLQVPEITPEGKYLLYARASDSHDIAIDSIEFEVGTRFNLSSFLKIGSILLLILIFAILLSVFMVKYKRDKKKERLLELYIMLNKLKNLIKQNKEEEALKLFLKIKEIYHDPVPKEIFNDKERLKKEIAELYDNFSKESKIITKRENNKEPNKDDLKKEPSLNEKELKKEGTITKEIQENKKEVKDNSQNIKPKNDKK